MSDLNIEESSTEPYFLYFEDSCLLFLSQIIFIFGPWIIIYMFFHFDTALGIIEKILAIGCYFFQIFVFTLNSSEKDIVKSLKNKIKKLPIIRRGNIKFVSLSWRDIVIILM